MNLINLGIKNFFFLNIEASRAIWFAWPIDPTVKKSFLCMKKKGLLENTILRPTASYSGIGHLRYSTSGYSTQTGRIKLNECQPLKGMVLNEDYYLVHNGNVPNIDGHDTTYINQLIMEKLGEK